MLSAETPALLSPMPENNSITQPPTDTHNTEEGDQPTWSLDPIPFS